MEIFKLVEQVLDELYAQIPGLDEAKDREVDRRLAMLASRYAALRTKSDPIDYSESATRLAYIYKYVTCHSNLVCTRIRELVELRNLFKNAAVQVACIGGGPGSDFLGILKYCIDYGKTPILKCSLFDRETAWGETWEDVDDKILIDDNLHTRTVYQTLDVCRPETYKSRTKYLRSDLFTMIYFVSEVYGLLDDGADDYFDHLFSGMRSDALVLYIDNNHSDFTNWVDGKFKKHKLNVISSSQGRENMPVDEEKRDLGTYFGKFASSPKLEADVCWRVARKR